MNIDTDTQVSRLFSLQGSNSVKYAYTEGIRDYMLNKKEYVSSQVGNPDGADKPNKKLYATPKNGDELTLVATTRASGCVRARRP